MVRLLPLALWAAIPALVGSAQNTPPVGVFLDFESLPGAGLVEIMKAEVNDLFRASGVSLDWRTTRENHGDQPFAKLVVLKFRGTCRTPDQAQITGDFGTLGQSQALGFANVSHGQVMPYSEVRCDQIRQSLVSLGPTAGYLARRQALGRALGRVVAHELYHMLANTTRHASDGLSKAVQSIQDLISRTDLEFGEEESKAIAKGSKQ